MVTRDHFIVLVVIQEVTSCGLGNSVPTDGPRCDVKFSASSPRGLLDGRITRSIPGEQVFGSNERVPLIANAVTCDSGA